LNFVFRIFEKSQKLVFSFSSNFGFSFSYMTVITAKKNCKLLNAVDIERFKRILVKTHFSGLSQHASESAYSQEGSFRGQLEPLVFPKLGDQIRLPKICAFSNWVNGSRVTFVRKQIEMY
jgi:hypothetical protein